MCPRCARATRTGTPGSLPRSRPLATRGNCSTCVSSCSSCSGRPSPRDQLTELIELGRFERDGITRLDVHRSPFWPMEPRAAHSDRPQMCGRTTRRRGPRDRLPARGSGGRAPSSTSTSNDATATSRTHLWSAGTTYHGAQPSTWRRSPRRRASGTRPTARGSSRSARRNFQFFSGSSIRAWRRARCSSFETWRNTFTIVVPSSVSMRSNSRMCR